MPNSTGEDPGRDANSQDPATEEQLNQGSPEIQAEAATQTGAQGESENNSSAEELDYDQIWQMCINHKPGETFTRIEKVLRGLYRFAQLMSIDSATSASSQQAIIITSQLVRNTEFTELEVEDELYAVLRIGIRLAAATVDVSDGASCRNERALALVKRVVKLTEPDAGELGLKIEEGRKLLVSLDSVNEGVGFEVHKARDSDEMWFAMNWFRSSKFTILHVAALRADTQILELLLPERVDTFSLLKEKTTEGWTALHLGSSAGHVQVVKLLLDAYNVLLSSESTPDKFNFMDLSGYTPLHLAVWNCKPEVVQVLIDIHAQAPNRRKAKDKVTTDCDKAMAPLSKEQAKRIAGRIVNLRAPDMFYMTPLHVASLLWIFKIPRDELCPYSVRQDFEMHSVVHEDREVCEIATTLIKYSKLLHPGNECINHRDCCSWTPLHWAVRCEAKELVRLLLKQTAINATRVDVGGKTPLHIAIEKKHQTHGDMMRDMLMRRNDVSGDIDNLYKERQAFVDSTNAILVGASLVASVTFAASVQPPLSWMVSSVSGAPASGPSGRDADVVHADSEYAAFGENISLFWIFDCLAFTMSIVTILVSARNVRRHERMHLKDDIRKANVQVPLISIFFQASLVFVSCAFVAAFLAAVPHTSEMHASLKYFVCALLSSPVLIFTCFINWRQFKVQIEFALSRVAACQRSWRRRVKESLLQQSPSTETSAWQSGFALDDVRSETETRNIDFKFLEEVGTAKDEMSHTLLMDKYHSDEHPYYEKDHPDLSSRPRSIFKCRAEVIMRGHTTTKIIYLLKMPPLELDFTIKYFNIFHLGNEDPR